MLDFDPGHKSYKPLHLNSNFDDHNYSQKWIIIGDALVSKGDWRYNGEHHDRCLEVVNGKMSWVSVSKRNYGLNQQWVFGTIYTNPSSTSTFRDCPRLSFFEKEMAVSPFRPKGQI